MFSKFRTASQQGTPAAMKRISSRFGTAALLAALCAAPTTHAALIDSTVDTFSNDGTTGVVPAAYSASGTVQRNETTSAAFTSVQSLVNPGSDGDSLDAANDGYLLIVRDGSSTSGFTRDLGTIEAGDVGKTITIDFDILKPGSSGVNSFYMLQLVNPDTTLESAVAEVAVGFNDTGLFSTLTGSSLSYTVEAGDVGKTAQFAGRAFVSSNPQRQLGIDAVSISVIPEPGSLGLAACGLGLLLGRKRREA